MKIRHITESDYQEMVATIEEQKKLINELQSNRITADKIIDEKEVINSLSNIQTKIESCLNAYNQIIEAQKSFIGNKDAVYEKTPWGYYKVRDGFKLESERLTTEEADKYRKDFAELYSKAYLKNTEITPIMFLKALTYVAILFAAISVFAYYMP